MELHYFITFHIGMLFFILLMGHCMAEETERRYACWGGGGPPVVTAQCPRNTIIQITRAGLKVRTSRTQGCQFSEEDCGCQFGEKGCNMPDVRDQCMGRGACRLDVTQQYIDTAKCHGFSDYMFVEFKCIAVQSEITDICSSGTFMATEGFIRSPNYPANYPNNRNCNCNLTTTEESTLSVTILDMSTNDKGSCRSDKVVIAGTTFCGSANRIGQEVSSGSNHLGLKFQSNKKGTASGFWVQYKASPEAPIRLDCERVLNQGSTTTRAVPTTVPPPPDIADPEEEKDIDAVKENVIDKTIEKKADERIEKKTFQENQKDAVKTRIQKKKSRKRNRTTTTSRTITKNREKEESKVEEEESRKEKEDDLEVKVKVTKFTWPSVRPTEPSKYGKKVDNHRTTKKKTYSITKKPPQSKTLSLDKMPSKIRNRVTSARTTAIASGAGFASSGSVKASAGSVLASSGLVKASVNSVQAGAGSVKASLNQVKPRASSIKASAVSIGTNTSTKPDQKEISRVPRWYLLQFIRRQMFKTKKQIKPTSQSVRAKTKLTDNTITFTVSTTTLKTTQTSIQKNLETTPLFESKMTSPDDLDIDDTTPKVTATSKPTTEYDSKINVVPTTTIKLTTGTFGYGIDELETEEEISNSISKKTKKPAAEKNYSPPPGNNDNMLDTPTTLPKRPKLVTAYNTRGPWLKNKGDFGYPGNDVQQQEEESLTVTIIAASVIGSILLIVVIGIVVRFIISRTDPRQRIKREHKKECMVRRNQQQHQNPQQEGNMKRSRSMV